jgi:hypothetical protein
MEVEARFRGQTLPSNVATQLLSSFLEFRQSYALLNRFPAARINADDQRE